MSTATILGTVQDTSSAAIPDAHLKLVNSQTGTENGSKTSNDGRFVLTGILPGTYSLQIERAGFATTQLSGITLNLGDTKDFLVRLKIGPITQSVTVDASGLTPNTSDASVTTVVDRRFVGTVPLNGQSFQDLISMTPGILTQNPQSAEQGTGSAGDFSVNGQRPDTNSFYVDGVSANLSLGIFHSGETIASTGSSAGSTALGTTQSLVPVSALQELRVLSATYSAEYGRTPGGQFTFLTRSGTETFHGSFYSDWRGNNSDASDWFVGHIVGKNQFRNFVQNDSGATFSGPVRFPRTSYGFDKTFLFLSFERLNLTQQPPTTAYFVPSVQVRKAAIATARYLDYFYPPFSMELPDISGRPSGLAVTSLGFADPLPAHLSAGTIRFDHTFSAKFSAFVRFGDTPSNSQDSVLSTVESDRARTQSATIGVDYHLSTKVNNEFRFGFGEGRTSVELQSGTLSIPENEPTLNGSVGLPSDCTLAATNVVIEVIGVGGSRASSSCNAGNLHQWNIRDTLSVQAGSHLLKFGVDQRHLSSSLIPPATTLNAYLFSRQSMLDGVASNVAISRNLPARPVLNQLATFVQDEWRPSHSLTLSLGLRSEANFAPHGAHGAGAYTAIGDIENPSTLSVAPRRTALWHGSWFNFAPRFGAAWMVDSRPNRETVLRLGTGIFFDTGDRSALRAFTESGFRNTLSTQDTTLPVSSDQLNLNPNFGPPFRYSTTFAFPRHLQLPYVAQWDIAIEKALGRNQTLTASYIGSHGARLLQEQRRYIAADNHNFGDLSFFPNGITSNYQSFQTRFQRSIARGLQALVSYTWAHSLDYGSTDPAFPLTYGNSDYDVRHNVEGAFSWDLPVPRSTIMKYLIGDWGVEGRLIARTSFPITLLGNRFIDPVTGDRYYGGVNFISHRPLYLQGDQYPGGRIVNGGSNTSNPSFVLPDRNDSGDAPRNIARGFGASQVNIGLRRGMPIRDHVTFQLKAEVFNILNHPNYGYIDPLVTDVLFGQATRMLNQSFGASGALFQQGSPRSIQLGGRLVF